MLNDRTFASRIVLKEKRASLCGLYTMYQQICVVKDLYKSSCNLV
jgi:hypothetical protein